MSVMIEAETIWKLHDTWTAQWHGADTSSDAYPGILTLVLRNHRSNFDLWHEEDKARDPSAEATQIATVKRAIDRLNQQRNDVVEQIDEMLLRDVPAAPPNVHLHSETPGMMIDRMSILALKIFHTKEQVERTETSQAHRHNNAERLRILEEQRSDLAQCLNVLWSAVLLGERRFKVYRQMKMYNDPELNPAIYGSPSTGGNS